MSDTHGNNPFLKNSSFNFSDDAPLAGYSQGGSYLKTEVLNLENTINILKQRIHEMEIVAVAERKASAETIKAMEKELKDLRPLLKLVKK